ncbi:crossover junction endodeoxyribonuclease RuvC [Parvibaculum lavamentivorans DS-1]|uniref:Crossover junction endodeoxyribonuclease RuvC n=1 Tax=Parvibaculum lavamentivorans (strain DS-1 / DSM 13023 / NCIMB 13966) TaxID=402881 RepID=RUVC_PARL1|nr:crossover junction endodeoxyribonuclease RuvC [Parvibaculum lavamentivorans]A7HUZ6.1 RecName: Full=Crossover junction endodeoxyribonuclease RuvC; AltName: Full=Holliday junction nuclease RuvC; AltName: Full=Holliday junction resolvase RuvC [Parvibaculum lavamentivorans DS-1]ABS63729.1 crossover junction endodeoxyribonuclease RuvC [Parvibaculum lavamentivorans DS-1]
MPVSLTYLGIDPGLTATGWGVIGISGSRLTHIANGTITSNARLSLAERLVQIEAGLVQVIHEHAPDAAAVEQAFVARDASAALKLGQARAIALLVSARAGLAVAEYAPNHVKKSVVGAGHADKSQIRLMVEMLLPGAKAGSEHAADALALAICHAHSGSANERIAAALLRAGAGR